MTDWLSDVLLQIEEEDNNTAEKRAERAFNKRANRRFAKFLSKASSPEERQARLAVVDEGIRNTAIEVATEYGANNAEALYKLATGDYFQTENPVQPGLQSPGAGPSGTEVCPSCGMSKPSGGPCPHCGHASTPQLGTTPGQTPGVAQPGMSAVGATNDRDDEADDRGDDSKMLQVDGVDGLHGYDVDHGGDTAVGREYRKLMQDYQQGDNKPEVNKAPNTSSWHIADGGELRSDKYEYERIDPSKEMNKSVPMAEGESYPRGTIKEVLDGSKDHPRVDIHPLDTVAPTNSDPKIDRKVDTEDLGGKNPYTEQKGKGGTFPKGNQADPVTSSWHIV